MNRKCYRFFGAFLNMQERWLNRMADDGWRLRQTGLLRYEFEPCVPGAFRYCLDFIGQKSRENAEEYAAFLREMGYRVLFKNINLNFAVGKLRVRPWADRGGRLATKRTTFNREILIVEKENDGAPFVLHTTNADRKNYYHTLKRPYLFLFLGFAALALWKQNTIFAAFAACAAVPLLLYQINEAQLRRAAQTEE